MRPSRRAPLHPPTLSSAALMLAIHLLVGCAAEQASIQKGESGPIAWEATDIRQSLEEQGNRMRWDYTLVLKNIGTTTVTFDQITLITMIPSSNIDMSGGHDTRPFALTLKPGAEARYANNSYSHGCRQSCDPQWVRQMFRRGVTRVIGLRGRDEDGREVTTNLRLRLDSSVGTSSTGVAPTPVAPRTGHLPVRDVAQIAGTWRGTIYGSGAPPATVIIQRDGQYTWRGDRESGAGMLRVSDDGRVRFESSAGRRGTLTLHESNGG